MLFLGWSGPGILGGRVATHDPRTYILPDVQLFQPDTWPYIQLDLQLDIQSDNWQGVWLDILGYAKVFEDLSRVM